MYKHRSQKIKDAEISLTRQFYGVMYGSDLPTENIDMSEWTKSKVIEYVGRYVGEHGETESLVEALGRLLIELDEYRAGDSSRKPVCPNCDGSCKTCNRKGVDDLWRNT